MMNTEMVYLDCDGTWIDLYGVDNWLNKLIAEDPTPYIEAKPLVSLIWLARTIHELQKAGYGVGVISWLSKDCSNEYAQKITEAKLQWFKSHLPSVRFDEIHIIPYGTPKSTCGTGYLFDDEEANRKEWIGKAFSEIDLIKNLRSLLK